MAFTIMALTSVYNECMKLPFLCIMCSEDADKSPDGTDAVFCDGCLSWIHFQCANIHDRPASKHWFCAKCKL